MPNDFLNITMLVFAESLDVVFTLLEKFGWPGAVLILGGAALYVIFKKLLAVSRTFVSWISPKATAFIEASIDFVSAQTNLAKKLEASLNEQTAGHKKTHSQLHEQSEGHVKTHNKLDDIHHDIKIIKDTRLL